MYKKVDGDNSFAKREKSVIEFWNENRIFEKSTNKSIDGPEFTFYDGPPTANGKPHIGHVITRAVKDLIPRFKTMKGYHVVRKAGWDTHGLPVELEVEKLLKIDGKNEIEKYGIEAFVKKCKESVWKYTTEWEKMSDAVSYWVDMKNPYITYEDNYIESVWWSLKEIFDKKLIYKGHKIVPYCPRCGTALSSHEVAQGYKDIEETSAIAKFKLIGEDNTYFLAWTTTPWTLPANLALCLNPEFDYVCIEKDGERYILAKELAPKYFEDYKTIYTKKGKELEGLSYEPLYKTYTGEEKAYYTTVDNYVTLTDGTGIVHIAPAFGEDDSNVGKAYNLPFIQPIDESGCLTNDTPFGGIFCKDADKEILKDLNVRGLLFKKLPYKHSYPFCWRCDTPLIYYARSSWFIKVTAVKDRLIAANNSVNWIPESIGKGRMGNFLENVVDWGISRERYWGTPLPLWVCECGHVHAIGSKAELIERGGLSGDIELHKPYVDNVKIKCDKCGNDMKRTPEVIDCWYDSGAMPFAQLHYPFENQDEFNKRFPADFISEAVDQTRGWFYTLLAISTLLFDRAPFKNCVVLGHVNDKNGIKMSKHIGNVIEPMSVIDKYGSDAVRWYFYTNSSPWLPSRFYEEAVAEVQRKYLGTLWNTYSFYILYADIDKFDPTKYKLDDCKLSKMDKWVLSCLNSLIEYIDEGLENYKITETSRALSDFTDNLSNWYVRRSRERYWGSGMDEDKKAAFMTLYYVLNSLIRLTAPFTPNIAESIYQNLVLSVDKSAPESVHLCEFPKCNYKYVDKILESEMQSILTATVLGRAARNQANIKNRQPLSRIILSGAKVEKLDSDMLDIIKEELNVKKVEFISGTDGYISYNVKPQLKTLGPKYGAKLNLIRQYLADNAEFVVSEVEKGVLNPEFDKEIEITKDDLLIEVKSKEGFSVLSENGITVILDTALNADLIKEGYMRELVSKIQTMRKESGFEVTNHIEITYDSDDEISDVITEFYDQICSDVLAEKITRGSGEKDWDINGKNVKLSVKKI